MQPGSDRPAVPASPEKCRAFCVRATLGGKQRLRHTAQFQQAYDQDRRWHGRLMVLFLRSGPDASLRLGVVASKKVGNAPEPDSPVAPTTSCSSRAAPSWTRRGTPSSPNCASWPPRPA